MKARLMSLIVAMLTPGVRAETLPLGAESRADELRLQRGDVDAASYVERERIRLETEQLRLDSTRRQLDNEKNDRQRSAGTTRYRLPLIGE